MLSYGTAVILRKTELTPEDWFRLAEARLLSIQSYLEKMTLPKLGKMNWMAHTGTLASTKPEIRGDKAFGLETRGIFPREAARKDDYGKDGEKLSWGITQKSELIFIRMTYVARSLEGQPMRFTENGPTHPAPASVFAERPVVIEITKMEKLLDLFHPFASSVYREMWQTIGSFVRDWTVAREKRYEEARRLNEEMQLEEQLYLELVKLVHKS
jgi:hypothetical protein